MARTEATGYGLCYFTNEMLKANGKSFNGQTVCLYAMLYSFERFFVEELRTDSLLIGPKSLVTALQKADYDPTAVDGVLHIGNFLVFLNCTDID